MSTNETIHGTAESTQEPQTMHATGVITEPQTDSPRSETTLTTRERRALLQAQLQDLEDEETREREQTTAAEREQALANITDYSEREMARVHEEMTALRADMAKLTAVWDRVCATETGAKVLHRIFGSTQAPQVHPSHGLAGMSLLEVEAKARPVGDKQGALTVAHVLDAEESRQLDAIAETVANTRAAV